MKKANGFSRFNDLVGIEYIPRENKEQKNDVKSPEDVILDSIFAVDEFGFPRSSIAAMLSEKTSDDVRKYIQDYIMVAKDQRYMIDDEHIVSEFGKLDSDFLATVSRNKYESLPEYEDRLRSYFNQMNEETVRDKRISQWKSFMDKYTKSHSDEDK